MSALDDVKSWMSFYGWTNEGGPGAQKRDADGKVVAYHGDNIWESDLHAVIARCERDKRSRDLMDEIEASTST